MFWSGIPFDHPQSNAFKSKDPFELLNQGAWCSVNPKLTISAIKQDKKLLKQKSGNNSSHLKGQLRENIQ